jgi:hypothetical protein
MKGGAALLVIGMTAFIAPAHASGETSKVVVGMSAESWYASAPEGVCSSPVGCPAPLSGGMVYPPDTLHIGAAAGEETARTYVRPDLSQLPAGATTLGAELTLPVSSEQSDGTSSPQLASVKACLATQPVPDGTAGDLAGQPDVDCTVSTIGSYDAKANAVTVDLVDFVNAWQSGVARNGVALIPDTSQGAQTDVWHLAFNGQKRTGVPHVAMVLAYDVTAAPVVEVPAVPVAEAPAAPPPLTGFSEPLPQPEQAAPIAVPETVAAPVTAAPISARPTRRVAVTTGFRYPMVFLVPFAFAAGLLLFARMFIRDVTAADPRVSWAAYPLEEGR